MGMTIRAGVTSPEMIVVIAISTIASFTLVNQSLVTSVSILRVAFIFASAFFGLFGFFVSLYLTLLYLSNIRIYGYSYMNLATDLNWATIKNPSFDYHPKAIQSGTKRLLLRIIHELQKGMRTKILHIKQIASLSIVKGCYFYSLNYFGLFLL